MIKTNYWHMQMHPTGEFNGFGKNIEWILEHRKFIGLGEWEEGNSQIKTFKEDMKVNDIVAIKHGGKLVALVQIIGGAYFVERNNKSDGDGDSDIRTNWIQNRRPIRVLDWAINGETLPHSRGTLVRCASDDVETTKIIKDWHRRVNKSLEKRDININV